MDNLFPCAVKALPAICYFFLRFILMLLKLCGCSSAESKGKLILFSFLEISESMIWLPEGRVINYIYC